jgi:hypothetical protein
MGKFQSPPPRSSPLKGEEKFDSGLYYAGMTLVEVSPGLDFLRLPPCLNVSVVKKHRLRSKRGAFPKVQGFYSGSLRCSLGMAALRYSALKL